MSTTIEFGNGVETWRGTNSVTIESGRRDMGFAEDAPLEQDVITIHTPDLPHAITGTPQDMRRLAFVLIGMTGGMSG